MTIPDSDRQMLIDLWLYAQAEPQQPAENPVTMWFDRQRSERSTTEVAYWIRNREWPALNDDGYPPESLPVPEIVLEHEADIIDGFGYVYLHDVEGWALLSIYPYASEHFGCWVLSPHQIDDARGIARRKGVIGPKLTGTVSLPEAATELGVNPATLRQQVHNGALAARKIGRNWIVDRAEVERYRRENLGNVGRPRVEQPS